MSARARGRIGRWMVLWACAGALPLTGCGPTRLTVKPEIPPLLMTPMPLAMGVRIPKSFAEYVQKEKGQEREWEITLGPGQAGAIRRVTAAMFEKTLVLGDQASGDAATIAEHKLNAILETSLDSYVYLLPSSSGGADYFSATIGYKVNLLAVDGTVLGSWIYEGYGSAPSKGLGDAKGVELVTGLAIRDACANLAVHLPDQELVRNLLRPAAKSVPTATTEAKPTPGANAASGAAAESGAAPASEAKPTAEPKAGNERTPTAAAAPTSEAKPTAVAPPAESALPVDPILMPTPAPKPLANPPETTPALNAVEAEPKTGN